jgi:hypothetical protein
MRHRSFHSLERAGARIRCHGTKGLDVVGVDGRLGAPSPKGQSIEESTAAVLGFGTHGPGEWAAAALSEVIRGANASLWDPNGVSSLGLQPVPRIPDAAKQTGFMKSRMTAG